MRKTTALCCCLFALTTASGKATPKPKVHAVHPDSSVMPPPRKPPTQIDRIDVDFETPVPIPKSEVEYDSTVPGSANPWNIVIYDKLGVPEILAATAGPHLTRAYAQGDWTTVGLVVLQLSQPLPEFSRVEVTFSGADTTYGTLLPTPTTPSPSQASAKPASSGTATPTNPADASIYLSGTVSAAENAKPSYNINSHINYTLFQRGNNSLLASGQVTTDNRPTADPDSFTWSTGYRYNLPPAAGFEWDFAGMQMDRKADAMNFVSAPKFVVNLNHNFKRHGEVGGQSYLESWLLVGMDVQLGLEFGDNYRDDFDVTENRGLGWFLRGVPGINAYISIPNPIPNFSGLKKINISSTYVARIPTTEELFMKTLPHASSPTPFLGTNTRNYVINDIQFMLADFFGFEIKHQYGSLPPTFNLVDNQVSVGLVVQTKQGGSNAKSSSQ